MLRKITKLHCIWHVTKLNQSIWPHIALQMCVPVLHVLMAVPVMMQGSLMELDIDVSVLRDLWVKDVKLEIQVFEYLIKRLKQGSEKRGIGVSYKHRVNAIRIIPHFVTHVFRVSDCTCQ